MLVFDIETAPLRDEELRGIFGDPDVGISRPGDFRPSDVKVSGLKDPAKIQAKLDAAQAEWAEATESYPRRLAEAKATAWAEFKSKAALSATTGRVLCIGYYNTVVNVTCIDDGSEGDNGDCCESRMLANFWQKFQSCCKSGRPMLGLNIHDFDLPFICRRSWILGVGVPAGVLGSGRYWHSVFVDLRKVWLCGQMSAACKSSFDELAAAFGTPGKPAGINGGDFAELWERDRPTAIKYLENDLRQPAKWAKAMGIS